MPPKAPNDALSAAALAAANGGASPPADWLGAANAVAAAAVAVAAAATAVMAAAAAAAVKAAAVAAAVPTPPGAGLGAAMRCWRMDPMEPCSSLSCVTSSIRPLQISLRA